MCNPEENTGRTLKVNTGPCQLSCVCAGRTAQHTYLTFWSDKLFQGQCATEEGVEVILLDLGTSNLPKSGLRCLSPLLDLS